MKKPLLFISLILLFFTGCKKDSTSEIDTEYPVINIESATAFPKQCSTVKRGETFIFRAQMSDNTTLGSVSIDIHHNFDHHTHSTELATCDMETVKTPVTPFLLIQSYPIAAGLSSYEVQQEIAVPASVDPGDYHFMIRLTDKEGWQTIKGLSIKII
ncbi:protein of unknown function [Pedobacter westerhofensis]|uniref:DUF4625 domain-containing protein n=1 Tax=Pedobacter westerhofensis TaxID=425512 RepID=A0A521FDH0_9SPHI|nr:DUF4625 domain-containing protein [Pedobacter westerhofensis]SMO93570.1 protein of unknown function [Pedobacter westerhofensis]